MNARVLVIDDELPVRDLCARVLLHRGYAVETAASGEEAVAMLSQKRYDLILSDLKMPGELRGAELIKTLRQSWPATRVIIMTGSPALKAAVATLSIGVLDYLAKPFDIEVLLTVVSQSLDIRLQRAA